MEVLSCRHVNIFLWEITWANAGLYWYCKVGSVIWNCTMSLLNVSFSTGWEQGSCCLDKTMEALSCMYLVSVKFRDALVPLLLLDLHPDVNSTNFKNSFYPLANSLGELESSSRIARWLKPFGIAVPLMPAVSLELDIKALRAKIRLFLAPVPCGIAKVNNLGDLLVRVAEGSCGQSAVHVLPACTGNTCHAGEGTWTQSVDHHRIPMALTILVLAHAVNSSCYFPINRRVQIQACGLHCASVHVHTWK
uniref:Uncharacterized protein n=1 Tax=Ananas comosus var. bracteatus TaxID=296719 RepID=A0A6V7PWD8_ANACO|nr:unnamed protein product [Ananas comosus var. bracteatus]